MKLIDLLVQELPKRGGWPEGAIECCRHYGENSIDFYDETGNWDDDCYLKYGKDFAKDCIYEETSGSYRLQSISRSEYESALAASQKVEWDGVGLPPIGCRVEYTCKQEDAGHPAIEAGKWYGGTIIAYHAECVWTSDNGIRHLKNTIFRPLTSKSDNRKYAAIESLFEVLDAGVSTSQDAIDIYDAIAAGKIPGVKLDD